MKSVSRVNIATLSAATLLIPNAYAQEKVPLRIVLIGDSTVCNYKETRADRGWGQFIAERFNEGS